MNYHPERSTPIDVREPSGQVCAVIVAYFPDTDLLRELLDSITAQVNAIVIVDNTPRDNTIDLGAFVAESKLPMCHTILLGENQGIAAAQNAGIAWAQAHNSEFVLLLDQDSIPEPDMVRRLTRAADSLLTQGILLAAIGPRYVDPRSGRSSSALRVGAAGLRRVQCKEKIPDEIICCSTLISSGSLIRLKVLKRIGSFDTSLFIDHVDNEWFLRARHHGYSIYLACGTTLTHKLGAEIIRYWFGRWRTFPAHSPIRHYYMLRNTLLLARYPHVPLAWLLGTFSELLPILTAALFLLPDRGKRLLLILRAIYDGLRNRGGPLGA